MRTKLVALVAMLALTFSPGCAGLNFLGKAPTPVQITAAAADSVELAIQLGEVIEQLRAGTHKLKVAGVIPRETDDAVQNAAISFVTVKAAAVDAMSKAANAAQLIAAAAPLVGSATTITTALKNVPTVGLTGVAAVVGAQFAGKAGLLAQASSLISKLEGKG